LPSKRFGRFLIVGGSNALLHFSVLNIAFLIIGVNRILSSIIATIFAMSYSFFLNKNFVFRSRKAIKKEVLAFVIVTATGVLVIHNIVYICFIYLLDHSISIVSIVEETVNYRISKDTLVINIATTAGAIVALLWNYNGYKRYVFVSKEAKDEFEHQK
jgi:putative flippase GtrA